MTGQTVSHYKIEEKIGEGGMGVVYRAVDTNLGRTVALKFLAAHLDSEEESQQRLIQEARAAASLDHPNICGIHEICTWEGKMFLVMAYLQGTSVKDRLRQRPFRIDEATDVAIQTAEGLQAAHEKGITHRDIKPANLMIMEKGQVKIMDFGLAHLADRTRLTKSGTLLGTPTYMSPEQARGQPCDRRTDIWALGVVLYEMLVGQPPFHGGQESTVIYSILNDQPEPPTSLRSGIPIRVDEIVGKALAKNPQDRYQHVEEMQVDLRKLQRQAETKQPWVSRAAKERSGRVRLALWAAAVLSGIVLAGLALVPLWKQRIRAPREAAFTIKPGDATLSGSMAVAPDGSSIVYAATAKGSSSALWLRPLRSLTPRKLDGSEGASYPFWSPDSRHVAFFADKKLKKMRIPGGPPETLCDVFDFAHGGTWNEHGVIVFSRNVGDRLYRVNENGGPVNPVTTLDGSRRESSHEWPRFLSGGRNFVYLVLSEEARTRGIYVASLDGERGRKILETDWAATPVRASDGREQLLFLRETALMGQGFNLRELRMEGQPYAIARGLWRDNTVPGLSSVSASRDGVLAFRSGGTRQTQLIWFDRTGTELGRAGPPSAYRDHWLSPDETKVVTARLDLQSGSHDLWIIELSRGAVSRFTFHPSEENTPVWSPDGSKIAFASQRDGPPNLYMKGAAGAEPEQLVLRTNASKYPTDWSDSRKMIVFANWNANNRWGLWVMPTAVDGKAAPYLNTDFDIFQASFSPDGRLMAYTSNESNRYDVYVQSFSDRTLRWQISTDGGAQPRWRKDGKELYYIASDQSLMSVEVTLASPPHFGIPKPLFHVQVTGLTDARNHYVSTASGQRFLVNTVVQEDAESGISVLLDWDASLIR
ncbi:MAG: serine/threonine-protein kinase [Acidobacteriia bacterium]|nr:serine/threonine-protein kinase [Terriglobia bacterium]